MLIQVDIQKSLVEPHLVNLKGKNTGPYIHLNMNKICRSKDDQIGFTHDVYAGWRKYYTSSIIHSMFVTSKLTHVYYITVTKTKLIKFYKIYFFQLEYNRAIYQLNTFFLLQYHQIYIREYYQNVLNGRK